MEYIYRPQRSCEGYVFTGVCLSTGGGGYPSMPCRWYPSMPCSRSLGVVVSKHALQQVSRGGSCSRGLPPVGRCACSGGCLLPSVCVCVCVCVEETPSPPADGYCCGRYASYWNAFLHFSCTGGLNVLPWNSTKMCFEDVNSPTCDGFCNTGWSRRRVLFNHGSILTCKVFCVCTLLVRIFR